MKEMYNFMIAAGASKDDAELEAFRHQNKSAKIAQLESIQGVGYERKEIRQAIVHAADDIAQLCYHASKRNKLLKSIQRSIGITNILILVALLAFTLQA